MSSNAHGPETRLSGSTKANWSRNTSPLRSLLTMMGGGPGGGGFTQLGIGFRNAGSNIEMWKTGCTARKGSRSHKVTECMPGCARKSYGPRNLSASFLEGHVVPKN